MTPEQDNDCFGHCNGGKKCGLTILVDHFLSYL